MKNQKDLFNKTLSDNKANWQDETDVDFHEHVATGMGDIYISNPTGNLALQQEIETFMEQLKKKYP